MRSLPFRRSPIAVLIAAALMAPTAALSSGRMTPIALPGQQAGGVASGAVFDGLFGVPVLNAAGQVAYWGRLAPGAAGVTTDNDEGFWLNGALVAREGSQAPGVPAGTVFGSLVFAGRMLSDGGQLIFTAPLRPGAGGGTTTDGSIWRGTTLIARQGSQAPGVPSGAIFSGWEAPASSTAGHVVFRGRLASGAGGVTTDNDLGIWRDSTLIARQGAQAPGLPSGALLLGFFTPTVSAAGQVAYTATLQQGTGGVTSNDDQGLWRDNVLVARKGQQAPGTATGAVFSSFSGTVALNDVGQVAYLGILQSGAGGVTSDNNQGIWRDATLVAREGSQAPGAPTGAVFNGFAGTIQINGGGQVLFSAGLRLGNGGVTDLNNAGLWRDTTLVAREGAQAPGTPTGATFSFLNSPSLNDNGQVAFLGLLRAGEGGVSAGNDSGLWIVGSNGDALLAVREGDTLDGRTITGLAIESGSPANESVGRSFNNQGQLAYRASFSDGAQGVYLFTPELRWTRGTSSSWDVRSNWTIGQAPGAVHDVRIDPATSLTVTGPVVDTTVRSLTVGGGAGIGTLRMAAGRLEVSTPLRVLSTGVLTGDGVVVGGVTSQGEVRADNLTILGGLSNAGLVTGSGRLVTALDNGTSGQVRVGTGAALRLTGSGHDNQGLVEVRQGGELEVAGALVNQTAGRIVVDHGTVRFADGLANSGQLLVSFGGASVFGAVTNQVGGRIILSGNSDTTFYDPVVNQGELRVSAGSVATFFGPVSGAGTFTGTGTKFYEGLFSPGASPGRVTDEGNSLFGAASIVEIELAGLLPGTEHDQFAVGGTLRLGGTFRLVLLDGFAPQLGDRFDVFDWGVLEGGFAAIDTSQAALDPGLMWSFDELYATGEISVTAVPEPGTWALMLAGLGWCCGIAARRRIREG